MEKLILERASASDDKSQLSKRTVRWGQKRRATVEGICDEQSSAYSVSGDGAVYKEQFNLNKNSGEFSDKQWEREIDRPNLAGRWGKEVEIELSTTVAVDNCRRKGAASRHTITSLISLSLGPPVVVDRFDGFSVSGGRRNAFAFFTRTFYSTQRLYFFN